MIRKLLASWSRAPTASPPTAGPWTPDEHRVARHTPWPSPDRVGALAVGSVCGAACAAWLDADWVIRNWVSIAAILAASAALAASNTFSLAIPRYVSRHVEGDDAYEASYRSHASSCSRYAGTVTSAVIILAVIGLPGPMHRSDQAEHILRFFVASYAGVLACDLAAIALTLVTFLSMAPRRPG